MKAPSPRPRLRLLLLLVGLLAASCVSAGGDTKRVSFNGGWRRYTGEGWGGLDEQNTFGLTNAIEKPGSLAGIDFGFLWAEDSGMLQGRRIALDSYEAYGGIMKSLAVVPDRLRAEFGCGTSGTFVYGQDRNGLPGSRYDEGWFLSAYARVNLEFRVGGPLWFGLEARAVRGGSATVHGNDLEGDYDQLAFQLSLAR